MPFFVVDLTYRERTDGSFEVTPAGGVPYATHDAADAAIVARSAFLHRRREAWMRVYGRPYPGDDLRIVEASDVTDAYRQALGVTDRSSLGQIRLGNPIRIPKDHDEAMPADVRTAYQRWREQATPPALRGDESTVEELQAYYRWEREKARNWEQRQIDYQLYSRWLERWLKARQ